MLAVSVVANMIAIAGALKVIRGRGGLAYLTHSAKHDPPKDPMALLPGSILSRREIFAALPIPAVKPIVFLGDSLTAHCEWRELFGDRFPILNRGIIGDTSAGVLNRMGEVARLRPAIVFLMVGINDGLTGNGPDQTVANFGKILSALEAAGSKVYLESLLPVRDVKANRWSEEVNQKARVLLAASFPAVEFVNVRPAFEDREGLLDAKYTWDGLHLNADGYLLWKRQIESLIK
jgi:lysophospholipase L1-like esterase